MADDRHDKMFRAFADRTRLRILNLLQAGEVCVGDLVTVLDLPQPKVSRHLAYLRRAGLVNVTHTRNWAFYRLNDPDSAFHQRLLDCLECCLVETPELQHDAKRLADLRAKGGCCQRSSDEKPDAQPRSDEVCRFKPSPSINK